MDEEQSLVLLKIKRYVSERMGSVDASHDMSHIRRVLRNARRINEIEHGDVFLIEAGVCLHDITDEKLFDKREAEHDLLGFFKEMGLQKSLGDKLLDIVNVVSFGSEMDAATMELTLEQKVVRDADRLDAMGAIGIARTFHYGGAKNREIYNAQSPPQIYQSTQDYRKSKSPTINHFYEKLLLLRDKMETQTGRRLAEKRHDFMLGFLKQFYQEIEEDGFSLEEYG